MAAVGPTDSWKTTMSPTVAVALIAAGSALIGGLIGAGTNYLVCRRGFSRSGAPLLADFEILEKARALQLGAASLSAIEARVQSTLEKHTEGSVGRSETRAPE